MADYAVPTARGPVRGRFDVPPSKSIHQRALALAVLADAPSWIEARGEPSGDVVRFAAALTTLSGRPVPAVGEVAPAFADGSLGAGSDSRTVHLGMNATGFRAAIVLACMRPAGARSLLRGDPRLLARPHGPLLRAVRRLGGHVRRRLSGSVRAIGGGLSGGAAVLWGESSSQYASALLLAASRFGGLDLTISGEPVSDAYLRLTAEVMGAFGVRAERDAPTARGVRIRVPAGAPRGGVRLLVEPDASSAASWWAAAALTGGDVVVPGLPMESAQPDMALLPVLVRMGASVESTEAGEVRVRGLGLPLASAGEVDLRGAPDLAPLVAALAAGARGTTRVVRAPHLRLKESDRIAVAVAAVRAVGGDAVETPDGFVVRGRPLAGGPVSVADDHRIALAFGVLGLALPGTVLRAAGGDPAAVVAKSYPGFLGALARAAGAAGIAGVADPAVPPALPV